MKTLIIISISIFSSCANAAWKAEYCIDKWDRAKSFHQKAIENYNSGHRVLNRQPGRAFDFFNSASSTASTYNYNYRKVYENCRKSTNITKEMAYKNRDAFKDLGRSAKCGMKLTSGVKSLLEMEGLVDNFNNAIDNNSAKATIEDYGFEAKIKAKSGMEYFKKALRSSDCADDNSMLNYAENQYEYLKENYDFFKQHY